MFKSLGGGDDLVVPPSKKAEKKKKEEMKMKKRVPQPLPKERAVAVEFFTESFSFDDEEDEEVEGEQERRKIINFERLPSIKMDVGKGYQEEFSDQASTPLTLQKQNLHMTVIAGTVQTTSTMTFHNEHSKVLAGQLVFPLPKDTSVHGYGLDINGVMVDAVPCPKEKARIAFETTVRERGPAVSVAEKVDPYANSFKTNVYPMNPKSTRTVKVTTLNQMIDDKYHRLFFIHVEKPASLKEFTFGYTCGVPGATVMVRRSSGAMEPVSDLSEITSTSDFEGILLVVPKEKGAGASVVIEKDPESGYHYFSATFSNLEQGGAGAAGQVKKEVKTASVFFDVSSSRRFSETNEELKFLREFMKENPKVKIEFYVFSNAIHDKKTFTDFESLAAFVSSIEFDGGTCMPFNEMSNKCESDVILLLSDGISNYGPDLEKRLFALTFGPPIYCISSASNYAYVMLRYLGEKSGGAAFDVTELDVADCVKKIGLEQFGIRNVLYDTCRTNEVFATPIINNSVTVYGRLVEEKGYVKVDFGPGHPKLQADLDLLSSPILEEGSTTIRTLWAQKKIDQLSIFVSKNQKEIERLGMEYGIVTSETSLIVLSDLSQYQRFKITPPRQLKDVRKQYLNEVSNVERNEENRRKNKIRNVITKWKRRIEWHKKDFKPVVVKKDKAKKQKKMCCREEMMCCRSCCRARRCCCESNDDSDDDDGDCDDEEEEEEMSEEEEKCAKEEEESESEEEEKEKEEKKSKKKKKKKKKKSGGAAATNTSSIKIKAYVPGSAYLDAIKSAQGGSVEAKYKEYLKQKKDSYEESPSFYLDCSDYFMIILNEVELGVRILSNISELELSNVQLLRIIGYRLDQAEKYEESIQIFEKVLKLKPEEPQSYRDLALVVERLGDFERAARLMYKVIGGNWDGRFDEVELTAAIELNHILENIKDVKEREALIKEIGIEKDLIYHMDCDIRISMAWDTDMTDIDLHVFDPDNEHCYYGHKETRAGGFISRDFTQGYGPEEYMQKKVWKDGKFRITAKYFASHQQSLTGGTTILTTFFTHYLQPQEQRKLVTIRLTTNKEDIEICEIDFKMVK